MSDNPGGPLSPLSTHRSSAGYLLVLCLGSGAIASRDARATDIWKAELSDGTVLYTDSPTHEGFVPFLMDRKPLPHRSKVNYRTFPLLDEWDDEILEASIRYDLSPELIKAVCLAESGMNPRALSPAGAMGLMQLMPATARNLGVSDPWDPSQNIDGGAKFLRKLVGRFDLLSHAIAAYNAGPANVEKYRGIPPFEETQTYVVRVLDLYDLLREERPVVPEDGPAYEALTPHPARTPPNPPPRPAGAP